MTISDILLHLDPASDNAAETGAAIALATEHDAHLAGLTTVTDPDLPIYGFAGLSEGVYRAMDSMVGDQIAKAKAAFTERTEKAGIGTDFRAAKTYGAEVHEVVATHGRHADLVIVRQSDPEVPRAGGRDVIEEIVLAAGRPVLVIPYMGTHEKIASNVVVGWDGSREAARALGDAMPLIRKAGKVNVLVVNPHSRGDAHGELPGADISTHLARHGLNVNLMVESASGIDPGNLILSRAADLDADMLVMGAFAHSRLQQTLFGGVTRSILQQMTLPVLLSH
ncbi:universal stress protein [Minwuia sp.]|uniref:universal stress protein n=1 Tax=Minwuia sp. TaxID=2493630 RepID=UPI003A8C9B80